MKFLRLTKFTFIVFTIVFVSLTNYQSVFGQSDDFKPEILESRSSSEEASASIDWVINASDKYKERLFIIARLGTGEKSNRLNLFRLNKLRDQKGIGYGKYHLPPLFVQGERVKGEGRIEFYVGSKLWLIILIKKNKIPDFTCCESIYQKY